MKFAANISCFYKADPLSERFNKAKSAGFKAVELQFMYNQGRLGEILKAKRDADVDLVLMNSPFEPGPLFAPEDFTSNPEFSMIAKYVTGAKYSLDMLQRSAEEMNFLDPPFGFACLPNNWAEFCDSVIGCARLCEVLKCKKLHILAGIQPESEYMSFDQCEESYLRSLEWALGCVEEYNIQVVIEPLCTETKPRYFLNSYEQALKYIKHFNNDNLKLLLDIYHLYKIEGDVEAGLKKYLPYAGHIQISQSPERNDPFKDGDIDYEKVLRIINESSYDGYIGLEYTPANPTEPDLTWMQNYTQE